MTLMQTLLWMGQVAAKYSHLLSVPSVDTLGQCGGGGGGGGGGSPPSLDQVKTVDDNEP